MNNKNFIAESVNTISRGFLETYNRYKVGGWAFAEDITIIPELDVYVNDIHIQSLSPNTPRKDLNRDKAGFSFTFPSDLFKDDEKIAKIDVRFRKTNKSIENSPVVCSIPFSDNHKVLTGKDEMLFLVNDSNDVVRQISGLLKMSTETCHIWARILAERARRATDHNAKLIHIVIPDKERVYADKLPDHLKVSTQSMFQQWCKLQPQQASIVYPLDELIEGRKTRHTYSKGDTHWNEYGAYLCYKKLCDEMTSLFHEEIKPVQITDNQYITQYRNADLLAQLGGVCIEPQIKIAQQAFLCDVVNNNKLWLTGRQISFRSTSHNSNNNRLLVFHDSFGPYMERLLASHFSDTKFVWSADVLWDEVDRFQPDIILIAQVERFLISPPRGAEW
jgi:hypothetical protein